ncbi:hypothetical protein HHK36_021155 [Tetracentron sinense]|uniref:Uncharacterized protein n=1 Tax=Tetracentron sinense TaxID=13715 RepID=A0A834YRK0_TETSI|nr:hypothetical protein HHK36_021155 [Tetracentron sinense]
MSPISIFFNRSHRGLLSNSFSLLLYRCISTPSSPPLELNLSHPIYMVWGSNTGVGKTLVSTGLAASVLSPSSTPSSPTQFIYIKPVQTGFPADSDSHFVYRKFSEISLSRKSSFSLLASNQALKASIPAAKEVFGAGFESEQLERSEDGLMDLCWYEERIMQGEQSEVVASELICKTMYGWKEAISPHLAAEREGAVLQDTVLLETLQKCLGLSLGDKGDSLSVIETAGGIASPGPSGTLQCDLYRPFRLPAILVGDGKLGGISGTISAYESLKLRGYDVVAVVFEDHGLVNEVPLLSYLRNRVPVLVLPPVPQDLSHDLMEWFDESQSVFSYLKEIMLSAYSERIRRLHDMPKKAGDIFWWPFTQHKLVPEEIVTVIDSRCGENFAVHKVKDYELITQQFDACASWWTQGPDATLQIELARDMGYAAARYGHVLFPENVYEPALQCAELLLEGVGQGWASRTFFSDNGSTAIEIALKMAFRKFSLDHGILLDSLKENIVERSIELRVLALNGSYHGDTLGAMEAQAPSTYTGFLQQPWYTGRGLFLDPPTVFMCNGGWNLSLPKAVQSEKMKLEDMTFNSRDELFYGSRNCSDLAKRYSGCISEQLLQFSGLKGSVHIGALIIEPGKTTLFLFIQAAGGMHMVDPLFQRVLVKECRIRKIPVIFDEVFTGFWRLGAESAAELLGCLPDIACFAKLMTGGVIPLAATLATDAVFDAFKGDSKLISLLHGHSYTAHAMGCTAATKAIKWFKDPLTNLNISAEGRQLREVCKKLCFCLDSNEGFVIQISKRSKKGLMCIMWIPEEAIRWMVQSVKDFIDFKGYLFIKFRGPRSYIVGEKRSNARGEFVVFQTYLGAGDGGKIFIPKGDRLCFNQVGLAGGYKFGALDCSQISCGGRCGITRGRNARRRRLKEENRMGLKCVRSALDSLLCTNLAERADKVESRTEEEDEFGVRAVSGLPFISKDPHPTGVFNQGSLLKGLFDEGSTRCSSLGLTQNAGVGDDRRVSGPGFGSEHLGRTDRGVVSSSPIQGSVDSDPFGLNPIIHRQGCNPKPLRRISSSLDMSDWPGFAEESLSVDCGSGERSYGSLQNLVANFAGGLVLKGYQKDLNTIGLLREYTDPWLVKVRREVLRSLQLGLSAEGDASESQPPGAMPLVQHHQGWILHFLR